MNGPTSDESPEGRSRAIAPAPHRADIGIVAALPIETGDIVDRLKKVRKFKSQGMTVLEGEHNGRVVAMVHSGMGMARARKAAEHLIFGHRPYWIVHPGFCGGLDPALKSCDVVLPSEIVRPDGEPISVPIRPDLLPQGIVTGRLLTMDRILRLPDEKKEWHDRTGAVAVDMESYAVAELCRSLNLRWVGLRVVSDTAGDELPPEILTITGPTGAFRLGATIGALWQRPGAVKDLLKLRESAILAAEKVAHYAGHLIDALPVP